MNVISDIAVKDNIRMSEFHHPKTGSINCEETKTLQSIEVLEKIMPVILKEKIVKVDKKKKKSRNKKIADKSE